MTTTTHTLRVLLLERDASATRPTLELSPDPRFDVVNAADLPAALDALRRRPCDVVVVDIGALDAPDPGPLADLNAAAPAAAVVVLWDVGAEAAARAWSHAGAQDCVPRPCLLSQCGFGRELLRRALIHAHERKRIEERLADLALRDALTGLPNRRALDGMLLGAMARARRHGRQFAVLFIDLDGFKAVNDRLGHAAGDEVLRETAKRLGQGLRRSDVVARLGGDEFLAVVEDVDGQRGAEQVAAKVARLLARPFAAGGRSVRCPASIGIALGPPAHGDADPDALIATADAAMYRAKRARRDDEQAR